MGGDIVQAAAFVERSMTCSDPKKPSTGLATRRYSIKLI